MRLQKRRKAAQDLRRVVGRPDRESRNRVVDIDQWLDNDARSPRSACAPGVDAHTYAGGNHPEDTGGIRRVLDDVWKESGVVTQGEKQPAKSAERLFGPQHERLISQVTIGIWAPILLTVARCLQGFSAGGEYANAVTYVVAHAPDGQRSRYSSWMPAATFASFAFAAMLPYFLTTSLSSSAMLEWGWRVVFLVAAPLGLVAVYIRVRLEESPLFQRILNGPQQFTRR